MKVTINTDVLDRLVNNIDRTLASIVEEVASEAVETAKRLAPIDTGELRASINYEVFDDGKHAEIVADAGYAAYQELGTQHNPPHPFLAPAMDEAQLKFDELVRDSIRKTAEE